MCTNKANLLVAVLRASGYHAGFHIMRVDGHRYFGPIAPTWWSERFTSKSVHILAAVQLRGRWLKVDPSDDYAFSSSTQHINPQSRLVEFNGVREAILNLDPVHVHSTSARLASIDFQMGKRPVMPSVYFKAMDMCVQFGRNYGACFKDIRSFHCAFLVWLVCAHPDICRDLLSLAPDLPLPLKKRERCSVVEGRLRGKRGRHVSGHVSKQLVPLFYLVLFVLVVWCSLALVGKRCVLVAPTCFTLHKSPWHPCCPGLAGETAFAVADRKVLVNETFADSAGSVLSVVDTDGHFAIRAIGFVTRAVGKTWLSSIVRSEEHLREYRSGFVAFIDDRQCVGASPLFLPDLVNFLGKHGSVFSRIALAATGLTLKLCKTVVGMARLKHVRCFSSVVEARTWLDRFPLSLFGAWEDVV